MHQRMPVVLGGGHEFEQGLCEVGMHAGGRSQIGLQTDVVEDPIGGEVGSDRSRGGGGGVDLHQRLGDLGGEFRIGVAVAQLGFPERIAVRRQELHRERAGRRITTQQLRAEPNDRVGATHPACLVAIALHRRLPIGGHAQSGQCAFDADRGRREVDPPDIRRHAAGQAFAARVSGCGQQTHSAQSIAYFGRRGLGHCLCAPTPSRNADAGKQFGAHYVVAEVPRGVDRCGQARCKGHRARRQPIDEGLPHKVRPESSVARWAANSMAGRPKADEPYHARRAAVPGQAGGQRPRPTARACRSSSEATSPKPLSLSAVPLPPPTSGAGPREQRLRDAWMTSHSVGVKPSAARQRPPRATRCARPD